MKEVRSHLGQGGAVFRKWAGIGKDAAFCDAYVSYCLAKTGNKMLYCNGRREINCPHSMAWCIQNLAGIPIYLAMEGDVTFFDWEPNGLPNHVGFVEERIDADEYYTIEGNTSGGIVARKKRTDKQEQLTFRLHYEPTAYSIDKKLDVDGIMGYHTIAIMQLWLGVETDAILGKGTLRALQRRLGVEADNLWGKKTTKALQKLVGAKQDGLCGPNTVKALQEYLNKAVFPSSGIKKAVTAVKKKVTKKTRGDLVADMAEKYIGKSKYVHGGANIKTGVDCTGLVREMYRLALDIKLPASLSSWGKSIGTSIKKAKRGDIITYKDKKTHELKHHAIYVGNKKVVHASGAHEDHKKDIVKSGYNFDNLYIEGIRRRWK